MTGQHPSREAGAMTPMERELLHSATRRALREMMRDAQDPTTFLAELQIELAEVLQGRKKGRSLLLTEFEAVLHDLRLEAEKRGPPPGGRP